MWAKITHEVTGAHIKLFRLLGLLGCMCRKVPVYFVLNINNMKY